MHHDNYHTTNDIVPSLINFLLGYVTLLHYGLVSHQVVHVNGADGTHKADRSQVHRRQSSQSSACSTYPSTSHVSWRVWDAYTLVESAQLCRHACMCIWYIFNCGFKLLSGSLIRKYMYGYTYMKVFKLHSTYFIMGLD